MQTVASLAERLDMSADEAVQTMRKLGYDVADVETEIDDDQCDLLIDVDEDPSALDVFLQDIKKKEEAERKKAERKEKAAAKKKAAAEKKAAAAEKKKAPAEKVEEPEPEPVPEIIAEVAPVEAAEVVEVVEVAAVEAETPAPIVEEVAPAVEAESAPEVIEVVEEAPAEVVEVTPEPPAEVVSTPEVTEPEVTPEPSPDSDAKAEPAPAEEEKPEEVATAEILPAAASDGTGEKDRPRRGSDVPAHESTLAKAEILQEREAEQRAKKPERPLPTPDPEVVAAVIRRDQEKRQGLLRGGRTASTPPRSRGGAAGGPPARSDSGGAPPAGRKRLTIEEEGKREQQFRNAPRKPAAIAGKAVRKKPKRTERARALESNLRRDAAAAVREFQSGGGPGGAKRKKKKRNSDTEIVVEETRGGTVEVDEAMTVEQLADAMSVPVNDLILDLMDDNMMVTKNQSLDIDTIRKLAETRDFEVQSIIPEEDDVLADVADDPADLVLRPPVVTIMGHVDHGKTSLLDVVRTANVADGEAGGITQHIAAYDVELAGGRIVFLDTPGHEAFTQMRSRGASVTDVVVLVVAADDGVKPQTIEAIDHAKAAEVPIVVAINKCDKPEAQPDRVRAELANYGLQDDQWGGDTIMKNVSAHSGEGIDDLMALLALESEMLELKANPNRDARGAIIESELSKGHGPVAWVLVQKGTLRVGDVFLSGESFGRVRTMTNSKGKNIKEAGPSTPVLVTGFSAVAEAGDQFYVLQEERVARTIADKRANLNRHKRGSSTKHMTLEDFHALMEGVEQKTLNVIIKADAQGSADVVVSSFSKLGNEEVSINVVHSGVGGVNESDVLLASASDAVIIGFHVTAGAKVKQMAETEGVDIRTYLVIYEAIDEVRRALEGMLTPDSKEVIVGHAEIRQVFRSSKVGNIAGSIQLDGETERGALARLIRDDVVVYSGKIATVRREKDEVKSVSTGYECGLKLERFDDIQNGDIIETYRIESVAKKLV